MTGIFSITYVLDPAVSYNDLSYLYETLYDAQKTKQYFSRIFC